ncbi:MAG: hypothetical protein A3J51_04300 [Omnitrophica WOR_2 bacterium RIFCSPHIGHO2_02_FULL_45_21]|nr:MAG: hypothetical protein A3J51_04300 [Omnitrophica WOR_2 bacterium RIFCSPHIGHO2_02_FULL_45_21]
MDEVLQAALNASKKQNILTVVVASTSGDTADRLFELNKDKHLKFIVVTHDEGKSAWERRFNEDIRRKLLADNVTVYTHNQSFILLRKVINKLFGGFGFPRWYGHLKKVREQYGSGIKVCHIIVQMLIEGKVLRDEKVMAIAGSKSGADSCAIFSVKPDKKWPILEEVILNRLSGG